MTKKYAPKVKSKSSIKNIVEKVKKTKPIPVVEVETKEDLEKEEKPKSTKYKCLDCGKIHHTTLVRYVIVYFGRKSAKNRINVVRRMCMKCESDNVSEIIQNKKCKNYGLTWKEVMNNIAEKEKPSRIEIKKDEGDVVIVPNKNNRVITYGEFA